MEDKQFKSLVDVACSNISGKGVTRSDIEDYLKRAYDLGHEVGYKSGKAVGFGQGQRNPK